jgi:hypothetical protein
MPYKYYLPEICEDAETNKADPHLIMQVEWPFNYVEAIKENLNDTKTLLIPPVWPVLHIFRTENIPYTLCYPRRDAKEAYRKRYMDRGNSEEFFSIFIDGWDGFMDSFEQDKYGKHIVLEAHEYLGDVLPSCNLRV